jgi:ribose 5-phosphate isomerase B
MEIIRIAIGGDHRGYTMKEFFIEHKALGHYAIAWSDVGAYNQERSDYPIYAKAVCDQLISKTADYGILLCGTGVGMVITANRFARIYAGLAWSAEIARLSKEDDNINVLVLPSDYISNEQALSIAQAWLLAEFKGERYAQRLAMID